ERTYQTYVSYTILKDRAKFQWKSDQITFNFIVSVAKKNRKDSSLFEVSLTKFLSTTMFKFRTNGCHRKTASGLQHVPHVKGTAHVMGAMQTSPTSLSTSPQEKEHSAFYGEGKSNTVML
ncbi:hypothetical protein J6590_027199, partial [Homalodisca vitripennis]